MCGIAGHVGPRRINGDVIQGCLRLMQRRGPDHAAYEQHVGPTGRNVSLLYSRLSIIDLDHRSDQPVRYASRSMVYNGELYNYLELRAELEVAGEQFATTSDSEVLMRALVRWGDAALDRCEGMWAFALYDATDGSVRLCRDRFGEKPLYVLQDGDDLYFGSEVKFITALRGRPLAIDEGHILRYLVNGYKALYKEGGTFFRGLREVPAAGLWRIAADGTVLRSRFWVPATAEETSMGHADAVDGVRQRLIRAVELRLRADVPLAFCMSGGVDSNALIAIAKRVFGYDVHGFTVVNRDVRYEEEPMVRCAVTELGIRHTSIPLSPESFLPRLRELIRYHDAPVYTITYLAHWLLMERVGEAGYRISISGTAADELFSGYYDHHLMYLAEVRDDPARYMAAVSEWEREVRPFVRNPFLGDPLRFTRDPGANDHIYLDAARFASYLRVPFSEPFRQRRMAAGLLRNRMLNEMFHENVPVILHEDDLNAMYFSIENRSPYLDRALFDFAYRIPVRHLVRNGRAKALLRDAMRGIVPDPILDSPRKVGFNAPIHAFLDPRDPDVFGYLTDDGPIFAFVRRDAIVDLLRRQDLPNSDSKFLFYFINAKMFLEEFAN